MHLSTTLLSGLSALALVCASSPAQSPVPTVSTTTPVAMPPVGTGHGLRGDGDGLLGCGNDYVVRFDRDGARFTPVLGHDAPAVAPLQLTLQSIRRGDGVLPCELGRAPAQSGDVAVYDRAAGIRERYELRDAGVEQSFVFDTLTGRGDLVVRCRLAGLGELAVPAADGGLDFVRDGRVLVHLGAVTGIDADGCRASGRVRLDGGAVELSLPAAFVDHAALPLVLDPFVGTALGLTTATQSDSAPHAAWHAQQQVWMLVFERWVSANQTDVMIRSWSPAAGLGTLVPITSLPGGYARAPRIAYYAGVNRCVVAYQLGGTALGLNSIEGAAINGNLASITAFQVAAAGTVGGAVPDLSGDPTGTGQGVIVYELQGGAGGLALRSCSVAASGTPTIGAQIALSTNSTAMRPRVSKSAGAVLAVTYEQKPLSYYFVTVRAVTRTGTLLGAPTAIGNAAGPDLHHPDIDGDGTDFMMVLEYQRGPGDRDVSVAQWHWNGSTWGPPVASAAVSQLIGTDESMPTVALLGSKYAIAWEQSTGMLSAVVQCRNFSRTGCLTCGAQVAVPLGTAQAQPALASSYASGATNDLALLMVDVPTTLLPPIGNVRGQQWSAHTPASPTVLSAGCGQPVSLSLDGVPGIGSPSLRLQLAATDPQATLGVFLLGIDLATPRLPCGSCLIVNAVATNLAVLNAGAASSPLPVPCDQSLIGFPIQAQGAVIGGVQNACPALNTMSMSSTLGITIVE